MHVYYKRKSTTCVREKFKCMCRKKEGQKGEAEQGVEGRGAQVD